MSPLRFWLLALAFDVYWALAVSQRDRWLLVLAALALLAWLYSPRALKGRLLLLALAGCAMDAVWLSAELFSFSNSAAIPGWMLALWLTFSCWWQLMLRRYALHPGWLAVVGALAGPFSYFIGERLGAMVLLRPDWQVFTVLALGWALFLPFSRWLLNAGQPIGR